MPTADHQRFEVVVAAHYIRVVTGPDGICATGMERVEVVVDAADDQTARDSAIESIRSWYAAEQPGVVVDLEVESLVSAAL